MSHFSVQWSFFKVTCIRGFIVNCQGVVIVCRNWQKQEAIKTNNQLVLSVLIFNWNNFNANHVLLNCY